MPAVLTNHAFSAFTPTQTQSVAGLSLKLYTLAYNIGLPFFGFYCLLIGYLAFKSNFLPRIIGGLMMLAGAGWLMFLFPPITQSMGRYSVLPGVVGELSLTIWLVVRGVNIGSQATASRHN